eukprot:g25825.t1
MEKLAVLPMAPGFELTVPLLVLGIAMACARQFTVGIVLCAAAFLWDYLAQQRAKRQAANADLAKVLALRGRAKLQQGLSGLANNELRWALEELGPLEEGRQQGEEIKKLRKELRLARSSADASKRKPKIAPADVKIRRVADPIPATLAPLVGPLVNHAEPRTWQSDAVEAVRVDGFLSSLNLECHGKSLTLADAQATKDERCQLGYMAGKPRFRGRTVPTRSRMT